MSKFPLAQRELCLAKKTLKVSLVIEKSPGGTVMYLHKSSHLFTVLYWVGKSVEKKKLVMGKILLEAGLCWPRLEPGNTSLTLF